MTGEEETTYGDAMETIWVYLLFYVLAVMRDTTEKVSQLIWPKNEEEGRDGYIPLYCNFEKFYKRYCYARMSEIFNVPITTMAAPLTKIKERVMTDKLGDLRETGREIQLINMTSYNYLDMNQNQGHRANSVKEELQKQRAYPPARPDLKLGQWTCTCIWNQ